MLRALSDPSGRPCRITHQCDDVVDWSINNGILDITKGFTKAQPENKSEEIDDGVEDDHAPGMDVTDLADDDDDEDDGEFRYFEFGNLRK